MKRLILSWLLKHIRTAVAVTLCLVLLLLLLGSALGPALVNLTRRGLENIAARVTSTTAAAPIIVEQLQALNRLETARQISRHVIEAKSESPLLPEFLTKDKLLMLVQTEVIAGIDLSRITTEAVQVEGRRVVLHLPKPRILSVRIQDEHSRVYSRERGWIVFKPDLDLERQARLKAQADAQEAALRSDVLTTARVNAEKNLLSLLQSLGFRGVEFRWEGSGVPPASTDSDGAPS